MTAIPRSGISRRNMLSIGGGTLLAPCIASFAHTFTSSYTTVVEGTNVAAAVAPDGRAVAFDLADSLWLVDISGRVARRLTDEFGDGCTTALV